jgi:hypothetical protein
MSDGGVLPPTTKAVVLAGQFDGLVTHWSSFAFDPISAQKCLGVLEGTVTVVPGPVQAPSRTEVSGLRQIVTGAELLNVTAASFLGLQSLGLVAARMSPLPFWAHAYCRGVGGSAAYAPAATMVPSNEVSTRMRPSFRATVHAR